MHQKPTLLLFFILGVGAAATLTGYALYQSKELLRGPRITILEPKTGSLVDDPLLSVRGTARNVSFLTFNGRKIFVDEAGQFTEKLLLAPGYNIIELSGSDRFGRQTAVNLELIYRPEATSTIP